MGGNGQKETRQKEGSLRMWLPGPGPAQALSGPNTAQARLEHPSLTPGALGKVGWRGVRRAHLACVELRIGVREASELPGTAVQVDVAGPKGGQEAQVVVH